MGSVCVYCSVYITKLAVLGLKNNMFIAKDFSENFFLRLKTNMKPNRDC